MVVAVGKVELEVGVVKANATVMRVAATDIPCRKYILVVVKMPSRDMSKLENVCRE